MAISAAASTFSTTSGRVQPVVPLAGATTNITYAYTGLLHKVGRAMSAKTTTQTNADILVFMDLF